MDVGAWEACRGKEKGIMFIPFFRQVSRGVVAVEPYRERIDACTLGNGSPAIADSRIGARPGRYRIKRAFQATYQKYERVLGGG